MRKIEVCEFGGPDVLRVADGPDLVPGAGEVVVRVHAAGINPADTYIRSGAYAFNTPALPYTPGFDGAGIVDSVGEGVDSVGKGDRVFVAALGAAHSGAYAESMVCPANRVRPLPAHLSFEQGAAVGVPAVTAHRALFQRGSAVCEETVLIHGASGGVGVPAVQMAAAEGLTVIGTASTSAGRSMVLDSGADHVLDHSDPGYLDALAEITGGHGPDLVVEMAADVNLQTDLQVLARYGRIVVVGSRGQLDFAPRAAMVAEADIRGMAVWNMSAADTEQALTAVEDYLRRAVLVPVVGQRFSLDQANLAHEAIMQSGTAGKMVLDCATA